MINLIRNELCKLFHKKGIYILGIITILFMVLNVVIYKVSLSDDTSNSINNMIEENLDNYNLNDPDELQWYVDDKTDVEVAKAASKYKVGSWQYRKIYDNRALIACMNTATYISKNNDEYNNCKKEYDILISKIEKNDWTIFINEEKKELETNLKSLKVELNYITNLDSPDKVELNELNKSIEKLEYQLQGINYRLDKKVPVDNSYLSNVISDYVTYSVMYTDYDMDEENYKDRTELLQKREVEKNYNVSKYILDNNINYDRTDNSNELVMYEFENVILFVMILIIMISGAIMSDEYNKGTIKQLLLKPYKRWKILLSKYIACLILFSLFMLFYAILCYVGYGIIGGFSDYSNPIIVYDFTSRHVIELSLFKYCILNTLALLPQYLILLSIGVFTSVVIGNTAVSIVISVVTYFGSAILNALIMGKEIKYLSWFPTMCWDLTEYLFGGMSFYKYGNLSLSIMVSIITLLILVLSTFMIFNKKDIKNI